MNKATCADDVWDILPAAWSTRDPACEVCKVQLKKGHRIQLKKAPDPVPALYLLTEVEAGGR